MQCRADQGGRCAGRLHGDELFDSRDSSADAYLHGGTSYAEPHEQLFGSGPPASPDPGKIEQQQAADSQVEDLPRQSLQIGRGPVRARRQAWHTFKKVQGKLPPALKCGGFPVRPASRLPSSTDSVTGGYRSPGLHQGGVADVPGADDIGVLFKPARLAAEHGLTLAVGAFAMATLGTRLEVYAGSTKTTGTPASAAL